MSAPFCTDCGTEAAMMLGWEAVVSDPSLADARVWSCPVCRESWCRHDPISDRPIGTPAGEETRTARALLAERQIARIIAEALAQNPNASALADDRITGFTAALLGIERGHAAIEQLDLEQCRKLWHALHRASYADIVRHAQTYRPGKPTQSSLTEQGAAA
ncbi:hypothetical protein [Methylobacterium gnaphalii]|uniref:Uncharacterized protein n=1 Tax=Methylobacterium gnaphalii TaxID=1010610 RepID=A0A512JIU9_9HYPH|nr:hypothetical protein [Methylobacterium gnaphalii]GEP09879.1 hypothetical protein MGN01_17240 [Methylobacterium gnaphalii]GJD67205.1 hypothetical protein MMMDOFMJ_0119 [Methylobacterium gnaphalii]GLS49908.1 hypothetical protein GCM10007885_27600 [Methylobacterium gnaphalii]